MFTINLHVLLCTSDDLKVAYSECNSAHSSNYPVVANPVSIQTCGGGGADGSDGGDGGGVCATSSFMWVLGS